MQIPVQTEVKYLGLYLDQKLTWQKHVKPKHHYEKCPENIPMPMK
jgi:hypothetical protein